MPSDCPQVEWRENRWTRRVEAFLADVLALDKHYAVRVVEEMRLHKGTSSADHLKLVLTVIDGPRFPSRDE
jgi:hypothetical protein